MSKQPNILLLVADQWRGDCLGSKGHPVVKTPFLDTLANQGLQFTNAYSAVPTCIAARCALMTGLGQASHGRIGYRDGVAWRYPHSLADSFTRAGYQTECIGKMHVHPLRNRMGFEHVRLHDGFLHHYDSYDRPAYEHQKNADDYIHWLDGHGHRALDDSGLECNGWPMRPWPYEEELHPTRWVGDQTLDFFRSRDRDKPFFLKVSFVRPHPPFDPPESYLAAYRNLTMPEPPIGDWADPPEKTHHCGVHGIWDAQQRQDAQRAYYALMTQVDHQIGRIIERMVSERVLDNTIILFVSDHGELLGDHNLFRKALPYEGSANVPLILNGPGIPKGKTSDRLCELQDVMPTLLSLAGIPVPPSVEGENILCEDGAREFLHGEHSYGDLSHHFIVTKRDKYIWFSLDGREQYFCLETDPHELHNAIHDEDCQGRIKQLRQELVQKLLNREEGYVQGGQLIAGQQAKTTLDFLHPQGR